MDKRGWQSDLLVRGGKMRLTKLPQELLLVKKTLKELYLSNSPNLKQVLTAAIGPKVGCSFCPHFLNCR